MVILAAIVSLLLSNSSFAQNNACTKASPGQNFADLSCIQEKVIPKCIDVGDGFSSGKNPEEVITSLTKDLSDEELFTRLIFAESLASQCITDPASAKAKSVSIGIAWILKNRIDAKKGKVFGSGRGVVTKTAQFRSSTGSCDVAKRAEFLCPEKAGPQWQAAWLNAQTALQKTLLEKNPLPNITQYFFPSHFDGSVNCAKWKGKLPVWASADKEVASGLTDLPKGNSCLQFFK